MALPFLIGTTLVFVKENIVNTYNIVYEFALRANIKIKDLNSELKQNISSFLCRVRSILKFL